MNDVEKTIVLDFDGVFHAYENSYEGNSYKPSKPLEGIQEFIDSLHERGKRVVVLSARDSSEVESYLSKQGIHSIDEVTNEKPPAFVYLDDRGITFNGDFEDALREIDSFKPWWQKPESEMPAKSAKQYGLMQAAAHGKLRGVGPSKEVALEFIHKTPAKKRKRFAQVLAKER